MKFKILRRFLYPILRAMLLPVLAFMATKFLAKVEKSNKFTSPLLRRGVSFLKAFLANFTK